MKAARLLALVALFATSAAGFVAHRPGLSRSAPLFAARSAKLANPPPPPKSNKKTPAVQEEGGLSATQKGGAKMIAFYGGVAALFTAIQSFN